MERDVNPGSVWFIGLFGVSFLYCGYYRFVGSRISGNLLAFLALITVTDKILSLYTLSMLLGLPSVIIINRFLSL